jgi:hypothetical protein
LKKLTMKHMPYPCRCLLALPMGNRLRIDVGFGHKILAHT